ncbi:hypothetical protein LCGC14_1715380 [marine sediment metagenome]|uniref:Uncharacterized protein n=1 Tax=marine sediment metagenome TaxID=412755 RepID=A0A0F9HEG7_9ZZZZ
MKHALIAQSMGEGYSGLFEIHYLTDNRAKTPILIAREMSQKWAERLVLAYNAQPDLLEALDRIANKPIGPATASNKSVLDTVVEIARAAIAKDDGGEVSPSQEEIGDALRQAYH